MGTEESLRGLRGNPEQSNGKLRMKGCLPQRRGCLWECPGIGSTHYAVGTASWPAGLPNSFLEALL